MGTKSGERTLPAQRMIGFHDFCYPGAQFRICFFAGPSLPQAASLVQDAYSRLGYTIKDGESELAETVASTANLQAIQRDTTLGTLSVNLDGCNGLHAEALYPDEVAALRSSGPICEFTQLALDTELAGREVLCSLFYVAYVFSHAVHGAKHLLVEVNPRHRTFYERMLGFRLLGGERICLRVGAPAVLLHLDFDFTREQIERARRGLSVAGTTLYRYAAPVADEEALIRRMSAGML
ncbi:MAG: long-chain N-acyl amino acid synthase [Betaproteobacteria bacterium]|nr:long-chain N-acyl amino acid synthase [Betaproteobacteria bacterium]